MEITSLIFLFSGIAISAAIFALLIFLYPRLVERKANVEGIQKRVDRALLPLLYFGIAAAYRTTERAVSDGCPPLAGTDKKRVAEGVYDILPRQMGDLEIEVVKNLVTRQQFEQMVQDAFNGFDAFYKENQAHFDQEYDAWKQQHQPPPAAS